MSLYKRLNKKEVNPIEEIETPEKLPKAVKPLSQKHFSPILEEVKSLKTVQDEIKSNQLEILKAIAALKKTDEKVHEEIKPKEEVKE